MAKQPVVKFTPRSVYMVVQKFCFYCPRALGANSPRLICDECAEQRAKLTHAMNKEAKKKQKPVDRDGRAALQARIDGIVARAQETRRML